MKDEGLLSKDVTPKQWNAHLHREKKELKLSSTPGNDTFSHYILVPFLYVFALFFIATRKEIDDFLSTTTDVPLDPLQPYTVFHVSGLDGQGEWRLVAVFSSESKYCYVFALFFLSLEFRSPCKNEGSE